MVMLDIKNLKVYFEILKGVVKAVDGISFQLDRGETMGLVGESGCGKTTTAFAITRLLPYNGRVVGGEIVFNDMVLARADMAVEMMELLQRSDWLPRVQALVARRENALATFQMKGVEEEPGESEILLSEEAGFMEDVKDILVHAERMDPDELKEMLLDTAKSETTGFLAGLRNRRIEKEIEGKMSSIRWSQISMIFQSAMNAFNPVYRVGDQIAEALLTHEDISKDEAKAKVLELFDLVGLKPERISGYPHEFSGGMRQRAIIAMALALNPKLIIADEPTTALDVIMQDRILAEIRDLQKEMHMAMMIITHDISVVAEVSEKIAIMYGGKLFEQGDIVSIFENPANPYTIGLTGAFPSIKGRRKKLMSIPGSPPDLSDPPPGCVFHPRCKFAQDICKTKEPVTVEVAKNHHSYCHFAEEVYAGKLKE
jgi:peptide/nickel transport system ATP-binding protein